MPENDKLFHFALDRIVVLERLVAELITQAGATEKQVQQWQDHIANWPDSQGSLHQKTSTLVETAKLLTIRKREHP